MRQPLIEGVEHRLVVAGHDATPGLAKFILHTIEGRLTEELIRRWAANPGLGLPHFGVEGKRIVQFLPLTTCAYTSEDGGIKANKAGMPIQVEVAGRADTEWDDDTYESVGWLIAQCMLAGVELDLDQCRGFVGALPYLATATHPRRLWTRDNYAWGINTIIAHQDLWGNAHWDVGAKDAHRICDIARRNLGVEHHSSEEDELMGIREDLFNKLDMQFAHVEDLVAKRADADLQAQVNIQNNLAALIRGVGADTVRSLLAEMKERGELGAGLDEDRVASVIAERLAASISPAS